MQNCSSCNFKRYIFLLIFILPLFPSLQQVAFSQGIGINETGGLPDPKAILDISSSSKGMLIPRMTTTQRDAIASPPVGLQIYNLSTNTIDIFRGGAWISVSFADGSNVVKVSSLADLPTPQNNAITLDPTKIYIFSGIVNISPYYLNLNGAGLRGNISEKDGVSSNVSGAVIRSSDVNVYIKSLSVVTLSSATKAYDFSDATGQKQCTILESWVVQSVTTLGVGNISGFITITLSNNYWNCADGIKIAGSVGQFVAAFNQITGISAGSGFEFLTGLSINFIELSDNQFVYDGQVGVKMNSGVTFGTGRMTINYFKASVGTPLLGFDPYTPGWEMSQNTGIANSRAYALIYMDENTTATIIPAINTYVKIAGFSTPVKLQKFDASDNNKLTYIGKSDITASVFVTIGGSSPANSTDITVSIAKNGVVIASPNMSLRELANNQTYLLTMESQVDMANGDYLEVFIKNEDLTNNIVVRDMQVRIGN